MLHNPPSLQKPLRIGTRGSPLAIAQAVETRERLMLVHQLPSEAFVIVPIRTTGDQLQDRSLAQIGGKGLFTKEIEDALLEGHIDIAVHSMKDVPTVLPTGLAISCILQREDERDGFVSYKFGGIADLPENAVVGTSSLRRKAQLLYRRPDLKVIEFRGNVQTRLRKLQDGLADATLLAMAGLHRLNLVSTPHAPIASENMLPAVAQGAIGIEHKIDDRYSEAFLARINDPETWTCVAAERAFLRELEGSCQTPIAGLAKLRDGSIHFRGEIVRPDGSECFANAIIGQESDAEMIGREAARVIRGRAGSGFFQ